MKNSINLKARTDIYKFVEKAKGKVQKLTKEVLLEIGTKLVDRSPVGDPLTWQRPYWPKGYAPGHFINNWQVGIDQIPKGIIAGVDPTGSASKERLSHLGRWQVGHTYYFVNNLPYAKALEQGHSAQCPPSGMIGLTRLEFKQIVKDVEARVRSEG
jgi:hypothetical protein